MKDLRAIYFTARGLPAEQRPAYLAEACENDPALWARVEQMLAVADEAEAFITDLPDDHSGRKLIPGLPSADGHDEVIGQFIGRYKIRESLGEGGCGIVYVAEQEKPVRRRVALKVIKLGMDTKSVVARFEAERQALAMMDHPNIAKVLDAGATETGRPYFVMELVRGIRITDYCDQNNLPTQERLELFIKVCQAIQHAHQKGIIHRDIKPSNILVTLHDGVPVPKVIDFGIAKATEGRLTEATVYTQLHQFIGTPAYMSPEQAEMSGLDIDTRSDIYSLGVLLYELLAGTTPFDARKLMALGIDQMRKTIRDQEPLRPSTRLATLQVEVLTTTAKRRSSEAPKLIHLLQGDLDWIVMKCLEKDRRRRYETASGLANDLKRHLTNEPVVARPPSAAYKFQKAFRRNKLVFTATAAVVLALLAGLGLSTWQAVVATRAKTEEVKQRVAAQNAQALATTNQKKAESEQKKAEWEKQRAEEQLTRAESLLYSSKLTLAQSDFNAGNGGLARHYLEQCQPHLRGWEWRYLWTRVNARQTFDHSREVSNAAYSPDGQHVVTGGEDGKVRMWDVETDQVVLTLKHRYSVLTVAFSPDGTRIVAGGGQWGSGPKPNELKVWDAKTGSLLAEMQGHSYCVWSAAFSPDGARLVSGAADYAYGPGETKVWDARTGEEIFALPGHPAGTRGVAFSPDGRRIVTGGGDFLGKVWDAENGQHLLTLAGHRDTLRGVAFTSDGHHIVSGSGDRTAKIWNAVTGREVCTLKGHAGQVTGVAFSPDGRRVVTSSHDRMAKVWSVETGQQLFSLKGHAGSVNSAMFSPDGRHIVTSSQDKTARIWDAVNGQEVPTLQGHRSGIDGLAFSPDSRLIVTSSGDGTAKLWDATSRREIRSFGSPVNDLDWDISGLLGAAFSPDGQRIVVGGFDKSARVWDAMTGEERLRLNHHGAVWSAVFSPDGRRILTGAAERGGAGHPGEITLWDAATGMQLLLIQQSNAVWSVAFSPDGRLFVTSGGDFLPRVWDASTGSEVLTLRGHRDSVHQAAFSPDGRRIVTTSRDHTAKVWDATTGQEQLTLKGHTTIVRCAEFSSDGQRIFTGSEDRFVKIWNADTGQELLTLDEHPHQVRSIAISSDGQRIATGIAGARPTAKVWYAAPKL